MTSGGYISAVVTKKDLTPRQIAYFVPNLLTQDGRDQFHSQCYIETNASNTERGSGYVAVSADTVTPAATDTLLAGEINSGGLARADATTKTHTDNTNSSTIEHTFTASATHTNVHKSAMFDAGTGNVTMSHSALFTADATLVSGDTLKVTWTLNLG